MISRLIAHLRALLLSFTLILSLIAGGSLAFGQSADETPAASVQAPLDQATAQDPVTPALADAAEATSLLTQTSEPGLDLSDPALVEALEARQKADRAIAEAVREQREAASQLETETETPEAPKKSLIPTSPDQIKAVAKKIGDTLLGWLTSPTFLAQVGAIVIIWWFLAPLIAKQLRKRIFLLRDAPKEGDKFLLPRKYLFEAREMVRPLLNIGLLALAAIILKSALGQDCLLYTSPSPRDRG